MPLTTKAKIGFIGSSAPSSPHHESFKAFIPKEIDFTFVQEENGGGSLYDAQGKVDSLIGQTVALVEQHGWDGVIISGGPREVLNPETDRLLQIKNSRGVRIFRNRIAAARTPAHESLAAR